MSDDHDDFFEKLPALMVFGVLGLVIVLGTLGFGNAAGLVAAVGFAVLLPLSAILQDDLRRWFGRDSRSQSVPEDEHGPLEELKNRYAAGELSDEEFERRTERLLDNESLGDVRARVDRDRRTDRDHDQKTDYDHDRELEYDN
ncbi:SHOCT domain-containing protein [Haloarchaeobius sp. DFWS5]|uniref:SHOCT domain-containing protein n=1 Tax=Haloarchaeobius sp. DFWS5 TaxID=3446114 RepID=UPI003EC10A69